MRSSPAKFALLFALLGAALARAQEPRAQVANELDTFAARQECVVSLETARPKAAAGAPLPDVTRSCALLENITDPRLKEPLVIRPKGGGGAPLPDRGERYGRTVYRIAKAPAAIPQGARAVIGIELGYRVGDEFKFVSPLNYAVIAEDGSVLEVGATCREALDELKAHLFGRIRSADEEAELARMSRLLLDELRAIPRLKTKLKAFAKERGWREGLEDRALLAYLDSDPSLLTFIQKWASDRGYTLQQLREAGWMRLSYSFDGSARWSVAHRDAVVIPFLAADGHGVSSWRVRNTSTSNPNLPKYLSFPKDRAAGDPEPGVPDQLYNFGVLSGARGKTVVITEGEFKALVAQESSGIATVGILGITNWDAHVIRALVDAGAREYVVILDRDPGGSGLMRADGVSDSQRAAYAIAHALEEAGARAKVGVLPDAFSGKKVGIDDLIMAKPETGVDGPGLYAKTIAEARAPEEYARAIGIDPKFSELVRRRRELSKRLRDYGLSERRGGPRLASWQYRQAKDELAELNRAYQQYLKTELNGATRLDQPLTTKASIDRITAVPQAASKRIQAAGRPVELELFTGDLIVLEEGAPNVARDFPAEDYVHDKGVVFFARDAGGAWGEVARAPEIIRKKSSGRAVALVLPSGSAGLEPIRAFLRASAIPERPVAAVSAPVLPPSRAPPELEAGVVRVLGEDGGRQVLSGMLEEDLRAYRDLIDHFRFRLIEHLRDPDRSDSIPRDYALAVTGALGELLAATEFRSRQAPGTKFVPDDGKGQALINGRNRPDGISYREGAGDSVVVTGLLESKVGRMSLFEPGQYSTMLRQWKREGAWIAGKLRNPSQIRIEVNGVAKPVAQVTQAEFLGVVSVYQPNGSQMIAGVRAVISVPVDPAKLRLAGLSVVSAALSPYVRDVFPEFQKDFDELAGLYRALGDRPITDNPRIVEILKKYDFQLFDAAADARDPALGTRIRRDRARLGERRDTRPAAVGARSREEFDAWKAGKLALANPLELLQLRLRYEPQPLFQEFLAREKRWPRRQDFSKVAPGGEAAAIVEERFAAAIEEAGGELAYFLLLPRAETRAFLSSSSWRPAEQDMRALISRPELTAGKRQQYADRLRALFGFSPG